MDGPLRVIFVDDDVRILQGLRRMLRPMRSRWDMRFANSAQQALAMLGTAPADVIVTDMRMPQMTGAELLAEVRSRFPQTARLVLSGQSDEGAVLTGLGPIHQFLQKPCDAETLRVTITQTSELVSLLSAPALRAAASSVEALPSWPEFLLELTRTLEREDACADDIANVIERDPAMTAKVIQLVNSAFFAAPRQILSVRDAVVRLGSCTIRSLLLTAHAFDCVEDFAGCILSRQALWNSSLVLSQGAARAARSLRMSERTIEVVQLSAMLAFVGRLVLIGSYPEAYAEWGLNPEGGLSAQEHARFGATYAEVGAYLLGLWGFDAELVDAVAFHRRPSDSPGSKQRALCAVHSAAAILALEDWNGVCAGVELDEAFAREYGLGSIPGLNDAPRGRKEEAA